MWKKMFFRKGFLLIIILSILGISCHKHKDRNKATEAPPVKVKVLAVAQDSLTHSQVFSGTVSSAQSSTVSFSVPGTITNLYLKEGDKVKKGQALGKIRNGEYLNAYNIAQAELAQAQDAYNRLKQLHDANALPEVKWVEVQQKLKQAQNASEMAKRSLDDAELFSPVSGTVTTKFADVGQTIVPAQPVYEIVSTNDLEIDVSVSENEIGSFTLGQSAVVNLDSYPEPLKGKVTQKSVTADPLTRTYTVKVAIPNPDGKILPGMLGSVKFEAQKKDTGTVENSDEPIVLPAGAVVLGNDNRWFVWVVEDSVAQRRFVNANELANDGVTVTSGLNPGELVIIEGTQKVGTGTKVTY